MGFFGKYRLILLLFVLFAACSNSEKTGTQTGNKDSYAYNEIKAELSSKKDLVQFNRISGMLSSLLLEQKRLFTLTKGNGKNETALKVEALLNEAALFASQNMYDDSFKTLDDAHETIAKSLREMAPK